MLKLNNVVLRRGRKPVLEGVNLSIVPRARLGIVGANGAGKSSLIAFLAGELEADGGELEIAGGVRIAQVAQESEASDRSVLDTVLDGDTELRELQARLAAAEAAGDGRLQASLLATYESIGAYQAEARGARLLAGLGFAPDALQRSMSALSGGWRRRAALAQALMCRSSLLLLDEPTNHLDLDAVLWLEDWLKRYPGALALVSHDREFLDSVVREVAHLENGQLVVYSGNYSDFERQRAQALSRQQSNYERQQRERARLQEFVDRFRAKATKARQAQSRLKALERLPDIAPAHVDSPFRLEIPLPDRLPRPLLWAEGASCGYQGVAVLEQIERSLEPGLRIALLGANGAGKSTFIKLLAAELSPILGKVERSPYLQCGYFAQHQLDHLRADESAVQHLRRIAGAANEQTLREYLGGFGFSGEMAVSPIGVFSGGEKARLALALLLYGRPNLLLLDEPTNHLDLEMREALVESLQTYPGALVLVSHDRHLIKTLVDELWLVDGGRIQDFDGDLDDYAHYLQSRARRAGDAISQQRSGKTRAAQSHGQHAADTVVNSKRTATGERGARKLGFNEKRELEQLPIQIEALEAELGALRNQMSMADFYKSEAEQISAAARKLEALESSLAKAYERWAMLEELDA